MPAIHIRNVEDAIVQALKQRATNNHRSMEAELRHILRMIVKATPQPNKRAMRKNPLGITTVDVETPSSFSREEIYLDDGR